MTIIRKLLGGLGATALVVFGAMLTTPYQSLRDNGASYAPALWAGLLSVITSLWFLMPVAALLLVSITMRVTRQRLAPKPKPNVELGIKMGVCVEASQHDQKWRFYSQYRNTMILCSEFDAFLFKLRNKGFAVPSYQSKSPHEWIDACCHYFTVVGPYLRDDDLKSAMAVAEQVASHYPLRQLN